MDGKPGVLFAKSTNRVMKFKPLTKFLKSFLRRDFVWVLQPPVSTCPSLRVDNRCCLQLNI
jgi:hypothetical protein